VKTRTLLLLALGCGLAILLAGGVFLVRTFANRDALTVPPAAKVGESRTVGNVTATVLRRDVTGGVLVVQVRLDSGRALGDASAGWSLLADGKLRRPVPAPAAGASPCAGHAVTAGSTFECALAFDTATDTGTVAYAVGDVQRQWQL
jgi:hypothetical protein